MPRSRASRRCRKVKYPTEHAAQKHMAAVPSKYEIVGYHFCVRCGAWHHTSKRHEQVLPTAIKAEFFRWAHARGKAA